MEISVLLRKGAGCPACRRGSADEDLGLGVDDAVCASQNYQFVFPNTVWEMESIMS